MQVENLWWLRDFSRSSHPDILWDGLLFGSGWIGILFLFGFFFFFIAQVLGPALRLLFVIGFLTIFIILLSSGVT
jgi:hypothetical protein